jgi:hypothetical protein
MLEHPKRVQTEGAGPGYEETYESEENGSGLEAPDAPNNAHRIPPVALHGRLGDALTHDSAFVGWLVHLCKRFGESQVVRDADPCSAAKGIGRRRAGHSCACLRRPAQDIFLVS